MDNKTKWAEIIVANRMYYNAGEPTSEEKEAYHILTEMHNRSDNELIVITEPHAVNYAKYLYKIGWNLLQHEVVRYEGKEIFICGYTNITKPPLGITPMWQHRENRISEICDAIKRYSLAGAFPPQEWLAELETLTSFVKGRKETW